MPAADEPLGAFELLGKRLAEQVIPDAGQGVLQVLDQVVEHAAGRLDAQLETELLELALELLASAVLIELFLVFGAHGLLTWPVQIALDLVGVVTVALGVVGVVELSRRCAASIELLVVPFLFVSVHRVTLFLRMRTSARPASVQRSGLERKST
jgi:hypothetical protein